MSAVSHRHFSRQTDPTVHASVNSLANRTRLQMTVVIFIQNRLRSTPQECNFRPQLQSSHRRKSPQLVSWLLVEAVTVVAGGAPVDGRAAFLGHVGCRAGVPASLNEVPSDVAAVRAHGDPFGSGYCGQHLQRRVPFPRTSGGSEADVHHQPFQIVYERMGSKARISLPYFANLAHESVVDRCVSLLRRSPRKSTSGMRPPPSDDGGSWSLDRKLFSDAQGSKSVPSTPKCSSGNNPLRPRPLQCLQQKLPGYVGIPHPLLVLDEH